MSFFDKALLDSDQRVVMTTRFSELTIQGPIAAIYGWEALHTRSSDSEAIKSQFQVLLELQGNPHLLGFWLFLWGTVAAVFALSRFKMARCVAHVCLTIGWAAVCVIFLTFKQPGIPLGNGVILAIASIAVCFTIVWHEAQTARSPCL